MQFAQANAVPVFVKTYTAGGSKVKLDRYVLTAEDFRRACKASKSGLAVAQSPVRKMAVRVKRFPSSAALLTKAKTRARIGSVKREKTDCRLLMMKGNATVH